MRMDEPSSGMLSPSSLESQNLLENLHEDGERKQWHNMPLWIGCVFLALLIGGMVFGNIVRWGKNGMAGNTGKMA